MVIGIINPAPSRREKSSTTSSSKYYDNKEQRNANILKEAHLLNEDFAKIAVALHQYKQSRERKRRENVRSADRQIVTEIFTSPSLPNITPDLRQVESKKSTGTTDNLTFAYNENSTISSDIVARKTNSISRNFSNNTEDGEEVQEIEETESHSTTITDRKERQQMFTSDTDSDFNFPNNRKENNLQKGNTIQRPGNPVKDRSTNENKNNYVEKRMTLDQLLNSSSSLASISTTKNPENENFTTAKVLNQIEVQKKRTLTETTNSSSILSTINSGTRADFERNFQDNGISKNDEQGASAVREPSLVSSGFTIRRDDGDDDSETVSSYTSTISETSSKKIQPKNAQKQYDDDFDWILDDQEKNRQNSKTAQQNPENNNNHNRRINNSQSQETEDSLMQMINRQNKINEKASGFTTFGGNDNDNNKKVEIAYDKSSSSLLKEESTSFESSLETESDFAPLPTKN